MQRALQDILCCPFEGLEKRILLESRALELMARVFAQVKQTDQASNGWVAFKSDDIDRIHHAREILMQRLSDPPSLLDLARQVGLNDRKLKQGFRVCFGTTAFGYLHDRRMEQARSLLVETDLSVTEVAHRVGYGNLSAFSKAFHKQFGIKPKAMQRSMGLARRIR